MTTAPVGFLDEREAFEAAMVEAGYDKPERSSRPNSGYLYQRDEDRFVGWSLASHTGEAEPVSAAKFIQTVPDHCDRIVWRGRYYHLPIATPPAATPAAPGEADAAKKLWETIKILGLSNEKLALQAITAALSHLAPVAAPASVPQAIDQLVSTLAESKGWMRDYARALIEDAIDRKHLEAAPAPASEAVAYLLTRPSGFAWTLMPKDITPETREVFEADGATIEPLCRAHLAGDSADAPVQQAGSVPMARIEKLASDIQRAADAERSLSLVSAFLRDCAHAALKGEQPEPSGSERGEVS